MSEPSKVMTLEQELINQIDMSELSASQQADFIQWLTDQTHLSSGLENALRRGQRIKAGVVSFRRHEQYLVRIVD